MAAIDFRTGLQRCAEFLDAAALDKTTAVKHLRTSVNVWSVKAATLILDALEQGRIPGWNLRPQLANETEATLLKVVWPAFLFSMFGGSDPHGFSIAKTKTPGEAPETTFGSVEEYSETDLSQHLRHRAAMYADVCRRAAERVVTTPTEPAADQEQAVVTIPAEPKVYLASWREILDALKLTSDQKDVLDRLNRDWDGPIVTGEQGRQPIVEKGSLLAWHAGLAVRLQELQQLRRDRQATAADSYNYGKTGTVVPEISGSVKKRRKDAKQ